MKVDPYSLPQDFYIKIENDDFFLGRLCLNKSSRSYYVEIDIVSSENKKILKHVDIVYGEQDPSEALEVAVQKLASYLKQPS